MEWPLKPNVGDVIRGEARHVLGQAPYKNMSHEQLVSLGYVESPCSLTGNGAHNEICRRTIPYNIEGKNSVG
jgi:hypothetical protein